MKWNKANEIAPKKMILKQVRDTDGSFYSYLESDPLLCVQEYGVCGIGRYITEIYTDKENESLWCVAWENGFDYEVAYWAEIETPFMERDAQ